MAIFEVEESSQNIEARKQLYLQRVHQFYDHIQSWLKDENLFFTTQPTEIYEELGHYVVPFLSIKTAAGELLAEMKPIGASAIIGEGVIEVIGCFDNDFMTYMRVGEPTITDPFSGVKRPIYDGIDVDGWYWDYRLDNHSHLIADKTSLLEIMTWVNDYEFV